MIKYYCDSCDKEVSKEDVVKVQLKTYLTYDSSKGEPKHAHLEGHLCMECSEMYKKEINQVIGLLTSSNKEKFVERA